MKSAPTDYSRAPPPTRPTLAMRLAYNWYDERVCSTSARPSRTRADMTSVSRLYPILLRLLGPLVPSVRLARRQFELDRSEVLVGDLVQQVSNAV